MNVFAGKANVGSGRKFCFRTLVPALFLDFPPFLRSVILISKAALGEAFNLKRIGLSTILSACNPSQPAPAVTNDNAIVEAQTVTDELAETKKALAEAQRQLERSKQSKSTSSPADRDGERVAARSLCWQDYCPCEPGQDGQGMEATLCRNLKAGVPVDDDIMAVAAGMRDARQQIRDFERDNPGF